MASLWAKYLAERDGKETLEAENGFAVFSIKDPRACYLEELFVHPDHRKGGIARALTDEVARIATERGCTVLVGSIRIKNDPKESRLAALSMLSLVQYGMEPYQADQQDDGTQLLFFRKHLPQSEQK